MRQIVYFDGDGRIWQVAASETAEPEKFGAGPAVIVDADSLVDAQKFYVADGEVLARPELPQPEIGGSIVHFAGYPEGAIIGVLDAYTRHPLGQLVISEEDSAVQLEAGHYAVTFDAPWPWLEKKEMAIEVAA